MLDLDTLDGEASHAVALELSARDIPVIPVTVMTLAEIAPIAKMMGVRHAMIVEAGGAAGWAASIREVLGGGGKRSRRQAAVEELR